MDIEASSSLISDGSSVLTEPSHLLLSLVHEFLHDGSVVIGVPVVTSILD